MKYSIIPPAAALMITAFAVTALAPGQTATAQADAAPVSQNDAVKKAPDFPQGMLFPYSIFDRALAGHIDKSGNVDYLGLKGDKNLALFLQAVATADISQFPTWEVTPVQAEKSTKPPKAFTDRSAEMVFWINAYNAYVVNTIAEANSIDSVDAIKDFDTAATHTVAGKAYSFHDMRDIIVKFDPRAVFALTDGTFGGPMLAPVAYRFSDINDLLNAAVSTFVNDSRNVAVLRAENKVTVNDYFASVNDLFASKNERKKFAGIRLLLAGYTNQRGERSYLTTNDYQIVLAPRDRNLNIKKN